jgi:hypothetical protein
VPDCDQQRCHSQNTLRMQMGQECRNCRIVLGQEQRKQRWGYSAETKKKSKVWSVADHKAIP